MWCCRLAPAICRLGFASAPVHWSRRWRLRPAGSWRTLWWRSGQHRLASLGTARRIHQSKTGATRTRPLRPVGETRPRLCRFGALRRVVVGVRQAIDTTAGLAVADRLDRHRPWPSQRRGGRHDLPELYAAMAYSRTLSAAGLEHRRSLGRQAPALAGQARCSDSSHPAPRQSAFSPPPRRSG